MHPAHVPQWLYNELMGVKSLTSNITLARTWLTQMATGAANNNLTIQYCMPYPRHAMQSVELPPVTQIRASDDYVPGSLSVCCCCCCCCCCCPR